MQNTDLTREFGALNRTKRVHLHLTYAFTGNYERYSLSRTLTGHPPIVAFVATLTEAPCVSPREAIQDLVKQYPMLLCSLPEPHTPHPRYQQNSSLTANDIFRTVSSSAPLEALLKTELDDAKLFDLRRGPLWRVTLYEGRETRVALAFNHVLCDGLGGRNLFAQLLGYITGSEALPRLDENSLPSLPPTLEETYDLRPGLLYLIRVIFWELFVLKLPSFLRPREPPMWPNPPRIAPHDRESRVSLIQISAAAVPRLKKAGAAHSVRALHSVLHTVALAALSSALGSRSVHYLSNTPVALRDPALGHPHATGNYISNHHDEGELTADTVFWQAARAFAQGLHDPAKRKDALQVLGMLAYIPNPEQMPEPDKSGWEVWMSHRLYSASPYRASLELSNLGALPGALPGVREIAFAQTPGPMAAGLVLNVSVGSVAYIPAS
jgi:hypothetical protein